MHVAVWSRHQASTEHAIALGATGHNDVRDAVADADLVITMLATFDALKAVMLDAGALDAMLPNATLVQMATIGVAATAELVAAINTRRRDIVLVDAPVSGSKGPAESGELLILASGPEDTSGLLAHVFDALGKRTMWLGAVGAGSSMKLVLNTWLAFQTEGAAESAALAESLGISPAFLRDALHDHPMASPYAFAKLQKMLDEDFHADFSLDWALKDLDLATGADAQATPTARAIADRWRDLVSNGASGLDVSAARRGLGNDAP
jgi:3-hydroxyisobutyrate dehydrogenase